MEAVAMQNNNKGVPNNSIALRNENQFGLKINSIQDAWQFAEIVAQSSFVPKDYQGKPGNCLLAIQFGAEIGLAPMQALQNIAVINGRPSIWGDAALALVEASPQCEDFREYFENEPAQLPKKLIDWPNEMQAVCMVKRRGREPQTVCFSVGDARRANLLTKSGPWQQYPKRMLQMRARSFALRNTFPHLLKGLVLGEEAMDYNSEPINITPKDNVIPIQKQPAPQNQFQPIPPETHRDLEARVTKLSTLYGLNHIEYRNRVKGWAANYWKIPAENFHFNTSLDMPMFKELWLKLEGFAKKFSSEIQEQKYSRPAETWNDKPRADKSHGDTMQCESCADDKTGFCPRCELINSYPINNENVVQAPLELPEDEKTLLFDQSVKKNAIACSGACGRVWVQGLSRGSKIQNGSQVIPWKMTGGGISDKPEQFFCFECWQKIQEQKEQYKQ